MRKFLPIKGPGGRALTTNEAIALLVLGVALVLCVLTLLAGESAFGSVPAQNPIFGFVSWMCSGLGGGIIALYALVLLWSGLIYFKSEKVARVGPVTGRLVAAFAVAVGLSGSLGIAGVPSAGALGLLVGGSLANAVGSIVGFLILFALMALGLNLAGQGALQAFREEAPSPMAAGGGAAAIGIALQPPAARRIGNAPPLPDDGDPSADERSLAIAQAMEEIERNQGVRIVEVERDEEPDDEPDETATDDGEVELARRPSIGEEVEGAPAPEPTSEEAIIQQRLREIGVALNATGKSEPEPEAEEEASGAEEEVEYLSARHGFVPVPPRDAAVAQEEEEPEETGEAEADGAEEAAEDYEEAEEAEEADGEDEEEYEYEEDDAAEYDDDSEEEEQYAADEEEEEDGDETAGADDEYEVEEDDEVEASAEPEQTEEAGEPEAAAAPSGDPYARSQLILRLEAERSDAADDENRPYTSFDWRGRPVD